MRRSFKRLLLIGWRWFREYVVKRALVRPTPPDAVVPNILLDTVERAKRDNCHYLLSIEVWQADLNYRNGLALWRSYLTNQNNVGHTWVRLVNTRKNTDWQVGHTGEKGRDVTAEWKKYRAALLYMFSRQIGGAGDEAEGEVVSGDELYDEKNPLLYLQHVYNDGYLHDSHYGRRASFEATFCLTKPQFKAAKRYIKHYEAGQYGGFFKGCGVFSAGVLDAALGTNYGERARHSVRMPDTVTVTVVWPFRSKINLGTPGTPNYERAITLSYIFPDALADLLGELEEVPGFFYKASGGRGGAAEAMAEGPVPLIH